MKIEEPSITEWGYISENPVSPNLLKNVMIGTLLGVFVAVVIIVLLYMIDDTVKSSDDIEKYLNLNTLTTIPLLEDEEKSSKNGFKVKRRKKEQPKKRASGQ